MASDDKTDPVLDAARAFTHAAHVGDGRCGAGFCVHDLATFARQQRAAFAEELARVNEVEPVFTLTVERRSERKAWCDLLRRRAEAERRG